MSARGILIFASLVLLSYLFWWLGFGPVRYFIYSAPLIFVVAALQLSKLERLPSLLAFELFILFSVLSVFIFRLSLGNLQTTYFVLCGFVLFYALSRSSFYKSLQHNNAFSRTLFWVAFLTFLPRVLLGVNIDLSVLALLTSSTSDAESNVYAFIFGFFVIYNSIIKDTKFKWLSFFAFLLTFKRIVFLAIITAIFAPKIEKIIGRKKFAVISAVGLLFYVEFIFRLVDGRFDYITKYLGGDISIGELTQGRTYIYSSIMQDELSLMGYLFGHGAGVANQLSMEFANELLHNDVLRLFYDNGAVFLFVFVYLLIKKSNSLELISFSVVCMLTDNVFNYSFFIFFFLLFDYLVLTKRRLALN
ncbi:MAG: hypothetical protein ACK417_08880 [Bacteroidia bacterium]